MPPRVEPISGESGRPARSCFTPLRLQIALTPWVHMCLPRIRGNHINLLITLSKAASQHQRSRNTSSEQEVGLSLTEGCDTFQYLKMKKNKVALRTKLFEVVNFVNMVSRWRPFGELPVDAFRTMVTQEVQHCRQAKYVGL